MASKRQFSYRWRLFIPMLVLMWTGMLVLLYQQYKHESAIRTEQISKELKFINSRIINAYKNDIDMRPFMNFINDYFANSMYEGISVCVYDKEGRLIYNAGDTPIIQDFSEAAERAEFREAEATGEGSNEYQEDDQFFYSAALKSNDGKIYVQTTIPYTMTIGEAIRANTNFWIIFVIFVAMGGICYFSTRYLTKNIGLLRDFATKAADNIETVDETDFPDDELGDISRKIIKLYRDKADAVKKSEREHKIALHAVEEKARIKRQLTNNINHELKTPVGVIKGYLDTIASNPDMDTPTRQRFISRAQDNVERLCILLGDVSTMTRLEEGTGNIPVKEIDFHDIVFTIENDLTASGINGNMKFSYNLPLDCMIRGNATLLTGMISNLIKNAAIHSGGTEMGLDLIVESERYYTFRFYDNGTGVDPQHLPHLFERFYRIDAGRSRKVGGTGLGLPIVKNTVEALGGSISVHNGPMGGLEFLFTLEKWKD